MNDLKCVKKIQLNIKMMWVLVFAAVFFLFLTFPACLLGKFIVLNAVMFCYG